MTQVEPNDEELHQLFDPPDFPELDAEEEVWDRYLASLSDVELRLHTLAFNRRRVQR
jgi:hypothetical protein